MSFGELIWKTYIHTYIHAYNIYTKIYSAHKNIHPLLEVFVFYCFITLNQSRLNVVVLTLPNRKRPQHEDKEIVQAMPQKCGWKAQVRKHFQVTQHPLDYSSVKSIVKNWEEYGRAVNLPRVCKMESTRRPLPTLKECQVSEAQADGVGGNSWPGALPVAGLWEGGKEEVTQKNLSVKLSCLLWSAENKDFYPSHQHKHAVASPVWSMSVAESRCGDISLQEPVSILL